MKNYQKPFLDDEEIEIEDICDQSLITYDSTGTDPADDPGENFGGN